MPDLPAGTVTLLFTDIEGSTHLLQQLGEQYTSLLDEYRHLMRVVFGHWNGHEVDTQGDAFFVAFARATDAVSAAVAAQRALFIHVWPEGVTVRVRMGLHTGEPVQATEGYVGLDVHRAVRIMSAGHGGQVLLSQTTRDLVERDLPDGVLLRDLGVHRLRDLAGSTHLYQLDIADFPADFPRLKTLATSSHKLSIQSTPFIGRKKEVINVQQLLLREDVRLLTLTGPGGVGKTRLGLQVIAALSERFADGIWFVSLASVSDPDLVIQTITQVFGLPETGERSPLEQLKVYLRDRQVLLLLDNFEQVVSASLQVADLLAVCSQLKVLVTSRVVLHVRAEREFSVPKLTLPDLHHLPDLVALSQYEAVALFVERAQAVKSDFQITNANAPAVAEVCARLDGLPLAIELAVARIKLLPPPALLSRLGQRLQLLTSSAMDVPARQQTLRKTIQWSYDLLTTNEQRLFRRLSAFVGGCTLEAIESASAVSGDALPTVLDGVASLIDKNLLLQTALEGEEPRLMMLETIREFGLEMLVDQQEIETTRAAHAVYYLALAEERGAVAWFGGAQVLIWLERLEREHDNLRAALSWSLEHGSDEEVEHRKEVALRLGGALHRFWFSHAHIGEGLTFLVRALAASEGVATARRAKALVVAADLAITQENRQRGEALAEEALVLYRALGDRAGIADALDSLGRFAMNKGEYVRARSLLEESVVILKELSNQGEPGWSLIALGDLDAMQGRHVEAKVHYEEALALFRELDDKEVIGILLVRMARLLYNFRGDLLTARSMNDEALRLLRNLGSKPGVGVAYSLSLSAEIALSQGDVTVARKLSEEALTLYREMGKMVSMAIALSVLARIETRLGHYDAARHLCEDILSLARERDDKRNLAYYLEQMAEVVAAEGELIWSARLWAAAEALREAIASPLPSFYFRGHERAVAATRAQLGERSFDIAWAEGRSMTLEQVLAAPERVEVSTPPNKGRLSTGSGKPSPRYPARLTAREVEVLRLVAQGLTDVQVADQLVISPRTVNTHLTSIYNKLGVDSRTAASRFAVDHRLV